MPVYNSAYRKASFGVLANQKPFIVNRFSERRKLKK
jgi:hypothetical protein